MLNIVRHGGYCCGARHIYGFSWPFNQTEANNLWRRHIGSANYSVEAVLTEAQLHSENGQAWAKWLKDKGFVFVNRWRNTNSRNVCYRFIYTKTRVRAKHPPIMEIFNV